MCVKPEKAVDMFCSSWSSAANGKPVISSPLTELPSMYWVKSSPVD